MGWLSLCAVAALAVVNVRVATLDGSTVEGPLRALGAEGVRVGGEPGGAAEQNIALDQVLAIERVDRPATTRPGARVGLAGGSRIAISSVTSDGPAAQLAVRNQSPLQVPLKQLRWIRFKAPSAAVDPQWLGLIDRERVSDALVIRRQADSIDEVSGIVEGITAESVAFDLDGDSMQAPIARLEGVLFASGAMESQRPKGSITIDDIDGSQWVAVAFGPGRDATVELDLGAGLMHSLSLERINRVELTGAVQFLAASPPVQSGYTPYVSLGLPASLATQWLGPEIIGDRDLIMRATSHVEYRIDDGNQTLVGSVEYDPAVAAGGSSVVRVLLDSKVAWEQTLDVSDPAPRGFELPLGGARRVRFEVDAAGDGDLGDTIRIRQPRMMK